MMLYFVCLNAGFGCGDLGGHIALTGWAGLGTMPVALIPLFVECMCSALVLCPLIPSWKSRDVTNEF